MYARVAGSSLGTRRKEQSQADTYTEVLRRFRSTSSLRIVCVSSANGDPSSERGEAQALSALALTADTMLHPKKHPGDLFAAAAATQIGLAAILAERTGGRVPGVPRSRPEDDFRRKPCRARPGEVA